MNAKRRGGFEEPYCSDDCYNQAGNKIGRAVVTGISGRCNFCQRDVHARLGSAVKLMPWKGAFMFICPACHQQGSDYVSKIQECCMCGL